MCNEYNINDIINNWKIIDKKPSKQKGKFLYDIICLSCNQTIRRNIRLSELKHLGKECNTCAVVKRNISNRKTKIGDKFGKLTVVGDGGYKLKNDGKRRHYSWVECSCGTSEPFLAMDNILQNGNKTSCGCLSSKGEEKILLFLKNNNIPYIREYTFSDLTSPYSNKKLRFDFAIFYSNKLYCLIEFDGRQHITGPDTNYWGHSTDTLETIQTKDTLKNQYCKKNNIKLIRIPYTKIDNIDTILRKELQEVMPHVEG